MPDVTIPPNEEKVPLESLVKGGELDLEGDAPVPEELPEPTTPEAVDDNPSELEWEGDPETFNVESLIYEDGVSDVVVLGPRLKVRLRTLAGGERAGLTDEVMERLGDEKANGAEEETKEVLRRYRPNISGARLMHEMAIQAVARALVSVNGDTTVFGGQDLTKRVAWVRSRPDVLVSQLTDASNDLSARATRLLKEGTVKNS